MQTTRLYAADRRRLERLRDRQQRLDEQRLTLVRELTARGISSREIAGPLGVKSHATILNWIKDDENERTAELAEDVLNWDHGHPMEDE